MPFLLQPWHLLPVTTIIASKVGQKLSWWGNKSPILEYAIISYNYNCFSSSFIFIATSLVEIILSLHFVQMTVPVAPHGLPIRSYSCLFIFTTSDEDVYKNARSPMLVTLDGISMLVRPLQP